MVPPQDSVRETLPVSSQIGSDAGGHAYLLVIARNSSQKFPLPRSGSVLVGRSSEADLRIESGSISRRHAQVFVRDGEVEVTDLGSQNGVRVNGERLKNPRVISAGDVVTIGDATLLLQRTRVTVGRQLLEFARLRERLGEELERTLDCGRPLSMLALVCAKASRTKVADALGKELRRMDALAWRSASELFVLLPELGGEAARSLGDSLLEALGKVAPGARLGLSCAPTDACDAETLLSAARAAAEMAPAGGMALASEAVVRHLIGDRTVIVSDPAMIRTYDLIKRLAQSDLSVLVFGETGTGKENAAAAVHAFSPRAREPYLPLNCATIPESLIESELFGHAKGAFSGAESAKAGLFEQANGGTVFLDELGELPLAAQAKLLRVLELKVVTRLGEVRERKVDVRVVAATNRDLDVEVREGRFRSDLLFRLKGADVYLPPLRERLREIPILARVFLDTARARLGQRDVGLSDAVLEVLSSYEWPGNVRELNNAMSYAAVTMSGDTVELWDLPDQVAGRRREGERSSVEPSAGAEAPGKRGFRPLHEELRELEEKRIREALEAAGGVQVKAAELIGMPLRTLVAKLRGYGLQARGQRRRD